MRSLVVVFFLWFISPFTIHAQNWSVLEGSVTDSQNQTPLVGATVLVEGTNFGTVTNRDGKYSLRIPSGALRVKFSFIGYQTILVGFDLNPNKTQRRDIRLLPATGQAGTVTVEAVNTEAGVQVLTPEQVQNIPGPFKDGFRAVKVLSGVSSNNELSNEYSVRGGGYNENLLFIAAPC